MRVTVRDEIGDNESHVKEYGFTLFDLNAVFVTYHLEYIPKGKRKPIIKEFWDKYARNSTVFEPELPFPIRLKAKEQISKLISVKTWNEYKN